jgi:hypothetical protein
MKGIQDELNREGLIFDQGQKKQAFFILQRPTKRKPPANQNEIAGIAPA